MKEIVKKAPVLIDTKGGSLSYNRTDMQISQTLHMAIELYPNLNYLFILDHYDDIALFDSDASPETVSYYQMKRVLVLILLYRKNGPQSYMNIYPTPNGLSMNWD